MARGFSTSIVIDLKPNERTELEAMQRSTKISAGKSRRAKIILLMADNPNIMQTAAKVSVQRQVVYKWSKRFANGGIKGLCDKPRSGRPAFFSRRSGRALGENSLRTT